MLLIYPPLAKPGEPPAGIARLAGVLRGRGHPSTLVDAGLEGLLYLLSSPPLSADTWSRRAGRNLAANLAALRSPDLYANQDRYRRAVSDINRLLEQTGRTQHLFLSLTNYQDPALSPLTSRDLMRAAETPASNIFYPYFANRLPQLLAEKNPSLVGFSLNYLSQALCTFAMLGFLKQRYPHLPVALGGSLVTSWMRNPGWRNPFSGLVDHLIAGPGEEPLLKLLGDKTVQADHHQPDYSGLPLSDYLSPGLTLPYAASSGCYWNRCSFCPEKAESNPYLPLSPARVGADLRQLNKLHRPVLLHLLDNAVSPALLQELAAGPPGSPWYGFARVTPQLADPDFCEALHQSGCRMLQLGIESGDQGVLDALDKGIDLGMVSRVLQVLKRAGIATYVYLLFGTPAETLNQARATLEFTVRHRRTIGFLNLAIFNMPICSPEAQMLAVENFYEGDLSLYTDFVHPYGWHRKKVRQFLDQEFKKHPAVATILRREPPLFTSNHAAFFC